MKRIRPESSKPPPPPNPSILPLCSLCPTPPPGSNAPKGSQPVSPGLREPLPIQPIGPTGGGLSTLVSSHMCTPMTATYADPQFVLQGWEGSTPLPPGPWTSPRRAGLPSAQRGCGSTVLAPSSDTEILFPGKTAQAQNQGPQHLWTAASAGNALPSPVFPWLNPTLSKTQLLRPGPPGALPQPRPLGSTAAVHIPLLRQS